MFNGDFARNGGSIYLKNIVNDMTVGPIIFDGHSHSNSIANQQGGSVYYSEANQGVQLSLLI